MRVANDNSAEHTAEWLYKCQCGSTLFSVVWREGFHWVECLACKSDNTTEVFGG